MNEPSITIELADEPPITSVIDRSLEAFRNPGGTPSDASMLLEPVGEPEPAPDRPGFLESTGLALYQDSLIGSALENIAYASVLDGDRRFDAEFNPYEAVTEAELASSPWLWKPFDDGSILDVPNEQAFYTLETRLRDRWDAQQRLAQASGFNRITAGLLAQGPDLLIGAAALAPLAGAAKAGQYGVRAKATIDFLRSSSLGARASRAGLAAGANVIQEAGLQWADPLRKAGKADELALAGIFGLAFGATFEGVGAGLSRVGGEIEATVFKRSVRELRESFEPIDGLETVGDVINHHGRLLDEMLAGEVDGPRTVAVVDDPALRPRLQALQRKYAEAGQELHVQEHMGQEFLRLKQDLDELEKLVDGERSALRAAIRGDKLTTEVRARYVELLRSVSPGGRLLRSPAWMARLAHRTFFDEATPTTAQTSRPVTETGWVSGEALRAQQMTRMKRARTEVWDALGRHQREKRGKAEYTMSDGQTVRIGGQRSFGDLTRAALDYRRQRSRVNRGHAPAESLSAPQVVIDAERALGGYAGDMFDRMEEVGLAQGRNTLTRIEQELKELRTSARDVLKEDLSPAQAKGRLDDVAGQIETRSKDADDLRRSIEMADVYFPRRWKTREVTKRRRELAGRLHQQYRRNREVDFYTGREIPIEERQIEDGALGRLDSEDQEAIDLLKKGQTPDDQIQTPYGKKGLERELSESMPHAFEHVEAGQSIRPERARRLIEEADHTGDPRLMILARTYAARGETKGTILQVEAGRLEPGDTLAAAGRPMEILEIDGDDVVVRHGDELTELGGEIVENDEILVVPIGKGQTLPIDPGSLTRRADRLTPEDVAREVGFDGDEGVARAVRVYQQYGSKRGREVLSEELGDGAPEGRLTEADAQIRDIVNGHQKDLLAKNETFDPLAYLDQKFTESSIRDADAGLYERYLGAVDEHLKDAADRTTNRMLHLAPPKEGGDAPGHLSAYGAHGFDSANVGGKSLLPRRLRELDELDFADFIDDDVSTLLAAYDNTVGGEIAARLGVLRNRDKLEPMVAATLGEPLDGTPEQILRATRQEYQNWIDVRAGNNKAQERIIGSQKSTMKILERKVAELRGQPMSTDSPALTVGFKEVIGRNLLRVVSMAYLGKVAASSMPDVANMALYANMRQQDLGVIAGGLTDMLSLWKKIPRDQLELLQSGIDDDGLARTFAFAELDHAPSAHRFADTKMGAAAQIADRSLEGANAAFFRATGMNRWNTVMKRISARIVLNIIHDGAGRMARAADLVDGGMDELEAIRRVGLSREDAIRLQRYGVNGERARRIAAQYRAHGTGRGQTPLTELGESYKGPVHPNMGAWDDAEVLERVVAAVDMEVDNLIVTPKLLSRPLMNTSPKWGWFGPAINQFQSFAFSYGNQFAPMAAQRHPVRVLQYIAMATFWGAVSDSIHNALSGRRSFEDSAQQWRERPMGMAYGAFNRAGLFGWLARPFGIMDQVDYGIGPMLGNDVSSMSSARAMSLTGNLGPFFDWANAVGKSTLGPLFLDDREYDAQNMHTLRKTLPFQNLIWLDALYRMTRDMGIDNPVGPGQGLDAFLTRPYVDRYR